jgi:hypothetical protein
MFDPFQQSKLMAKYNSMKTAELPPVKDIDNLDDLKKLAGVNDPRTSGEAQLIRSQNLGKIQSERNIRPGTDEWFRLHFAKTSLTGEKPYDE